MTTPIPYLRKNTGETPAEGGCIMQVIDWIDRHEWSDDPPCVHPVIRSLAIHVNDNLPDDERQKLLDLAPRMMGTNTGDEALTRKLLGFLARWVYPIYEDWRREAYYDDNGAVLACIEAAERGEAASEKAAAAARAARAARGARGAGGALAMEAAGAAEAAKAAWAAKAAEAAWTAEAAEAAKGDVGLVLLTDLLDHYDALTGRTHDPEPLDYTEVCEAMA